MRSAASIGGDPVIADLARMPHLLVAGTTGSGKSVGVNAMILSILFRHTPEECRFLMIDPKMLELSVYNGIPHLLCPVVTEPQKAVGALNWAVNEMEERYKRMSRLSVRNIEAFNSRIKSAKKKGETLARTVQTGFDARTGQAIYEREEMDLEPMPYIVIVVDEFADLMITAGKDIETAVQRLAQKARAAGIHLIMATQRPSVDIITGTIKAEFPDAPQLQGGVQDRQPHHSQRAGRRAASRPGRHAVRSRLRARWCACTDPSSPTRRSRRLPTTCAVRASRATSTASASPRPQQDEASGGAGAGDERRQPL